MSFGESMFAGGFNQKPIKGDLFVKVNHIYSRRYQLGKTLEHSRWQPTEANLEGMTCGAGWPTDPTCQPLLRTSVLHSLIDQIYAVVLSQFDSRA